MSETNNATEKAQLRQAQQRVSITGWLKELKLKNENDQIKGDIIIETGPNEEHAVNVFLSKTSGAPGGPQKENKAYIAMATFVSTATSMASLMAQGADVDTARNMATKVTLGFGTELGRKEFVARETGEFISREAINCRSVRQASADRFEPHATFSTECYFESIRKKLNRDGSTAGGYIVNTYIPLYNGVIIPFQFEADDEIGEYLESHYSVGCTGRVHGDIINTVVENVVEHKGFGTPQNQSERTYIHKFQITGGDSDPYADNDPRSFAPQLVREAVAYRENVYIPGRKEKAKANANKPAATSPMQNGFGGGGAGPAAGFTPNNGYIAPNAYANAVSSVPKQDVPDFRW